MRKRPAVGKCFAILYSDGQYRGDRWRNDVWGYVALSSQSSEKLSPELSADSFVWSFVCSVSRYPFRLMARIPIEAQVDINFTKKYICHFQLMLLFCIGLSIIFDTFSASMLVAVFVSFFGLTLLGPRLYILSIRSREG